MSDTMILTYNNVYPILRYHFDSLLWLFKASALEKDQRKNLARSFIVIDGICYATDGHRLHAYRQEYDDMPVDHYIPDGQYKIISVTKKQIVISRKNDGESVYPDVCRILSYNPCHALFSDVKYYPYDERYDLSYFVRYVYQFGAYIIDYIIDAFMPGMLYFEKTSTLTNAALIIGNGQQLAMIMPLIGLK